MLITPDIRDQAYRLFIEEVPELLQEIEAGLLNLRQERTHEGIHDLMRAAHSLKGGAACLELEPIKIVAHRLEDVFRALYNRSVAIDPELEGLLLQAYDCLRIPLQQITVGQVECESTLAAAEPIFNQIEERLGDALTQIDNYIPMSSELGVDLVASIFETDVAQGLERLATVAANPQDFEVAGELRAQAEVFAGFAELLNLPGFGAIAQTALTALDADPDRAKEIIQAALVDFHTSRATVLAGDRTAGSSPSAALAALTAKSIDLAPSPEPEFSPLLDELLFGDQTAPREATAALDPGIIFVTEADSSSTTEPITHSLIVSPTANLSPIQSLHQTAPISQPDPKLNRDRRDVGSANLPHADKPQIAATVSTRVELSRLERMHKLLGELVVNRNSIASQTEQAQNSAQELLRRFAHFQELVSQLQNFSNTSLALPEKRAEGEKGEKQLTTYDLRLTTSSHYQLPNAINFDPLEMDRYGAVHPLIQRILEEIVQLEEAVEDIVLFAEQSSQVLERKQQVFSQLQDELMRARMLPLGEVLNRFSRMLRDMSHNYSKPVSLKLKGTEVLIEKAILEKLYDPLLHLLRNAFAHGIESPEIRQQQGKSENGEILICAYYKGNQTIIEVKDDGRGLNLGKIRNRVVELGWLSPIEAASASKEQLLEFIFEPGFSTASHVSELSGRGMGLDVVRSQLRSLRGSVSVSSFPGEGTTFTLRVPLTLTIANLIVCSTGETTVALPADSIESIVNTPSDRINRTGTQQLLRWQEHIVPIHRLADLLQYNRPMPEVSSSQFSVATPAVEEGDLPMLLLRWDGELLALEVDRLLAEQEMAIKPFGSLVSPPKYTYGCTLLGDGSLVPVINGASLLEYVQEQQQAATQAIKSNLLETDSRTNLWRTTAVAINKTERPTVLIVDDSTTMRQTLTLSLQKAGYRVTSARDGLEALEKLQQSPTIQLVLCDIEMPNMNGFEFLCQLRQEPQLVKIPVAMLTSRSNDKHRRLATQLGAIAYFTKPYIEIEFLQAIENIFEQNVEKK